MAYLDYVGLAYFKSLLDENYLRTNYEGDTVINGNVTFTKPVDASVKNDWLGQQIDKTYLKDVVPDPEGSGALALILGDGSVSHLVTDTTVTQVRSNANELYPILLCYDASAEEDQIAKKVWYGNGVRINPRYGYLYSQKMLTLHPTYNRAAAPTSRVEWTSDFRDSVLNPVGQIFEYIDPVSQGGEHRMELRLYGNPNVAGINTPNVNYETNTVSLGVSATRGDALTFFGYAPSTPIYLEDGSTMRKSLVRGDQYGKDIITRDWLNLNGSITGLVHTYMDETIDGYKTFLKTVTIDSGDDNNKAGLNVQGDVNIDSGDANKPSNLYVQGNSHIHGNEDIDGNLNVDGTSSQHGNVHMYNNLAVDGTTTTRILHVTDDATVDDDLNVGGDANVTGTINKVSGNTTQEYVTYVTNQADTRKDIAAGLVDTTKGLAYNSSTGKIYVNANTNKGIGFGSDGKIFVDFSQIDTDTKAEILSGLDIQVPIKSNFDLIVNPGANNDTDNQNLPYETRKSTPFTTIQGAVNWASSKLALGTRHVTIRVYSGTYHESVGLPEVNASSGYISIESYSGNKDVTVESPQTESGHYRSCMVAGSGACHWVIKHLKFKLNLAATSAVGQVITGVGATANGAVVECYGCDYTVTPASSAIGGESYGVRVISADNGGMLHLFPDDKGSSISVSLPSTNNANINISVLVASRSGRIYFRKSAVSNNGTYSCSGNCNVFMDVWQDGGTNLLGSTGAQVAFTGTVNCQSVKVTGGSFVLAPASGFPGDTEQNYVQASTYCWASGID